MSSAPVGIVVLIDLANRLREPPGERHPARADADERELLDAAIALEDLVCDARQRTTDADRVHHDGHGGTCIG